MEKRTQEQIVQSVIDTLIALNPEAQALFNLQNGSRIRDLIISQSIQLSKLENILESIYNDIFISTASESALEKKLEGRGLSRIQSLPSELTMRIGSTTVPEQTITIPANFEIATKDDTPIIFRTLSSVTISPSTTADTNGFYTAEVQARSITSGENTKVTTNTVTTIITSIRGINKAYNTTMGAGGQDIETIQSMRNRLLISATSFDRGTSGWFRSEIIQNFAFVKDVRIVRVPYGEGTILLSLNGYAELSPTQLQDVQDYFMDDERADAGGWNIEVEEMEVVFIDLIVKVYRDETTVDEALIESISADYFGTLAIGEQFYPNRYLAYMITNIADLVDIEVLEPTDTVEIREYQSAGFGSVAVTEFVDV